MSKRTLFKILATVCILIIGGYIAYEMFKPSSYPFSVRIYQYRYKEMADPEYIEELKNYATNKLDAPINTLDWRELLVWERRFLVYTAKPLQLPRPELPIHILERGKGRCGEFTLLYNGLLQARGYQSRIVIDCSRKVDDRNAGDHSWNEVWINGKWIHVDPTENKIDKPNMYADNWNKTVNKVYAITVDKIVDVTKTYQGVT